MKLWVYFQQLGVWLWTQTLIYDMMQERILHFYGALHTDSYKIHINHE